MVCKQRMDGMSQRIESGIVEVYLGSSGDNSHRWKFLHSIAGGFCPGVI